MCRVQGLHHLDDRIAAFLDAEARPRVGDARRLVPDRLEQPPDPVAAFGRADQDRTDLPRPHLDDEVLEHILAGRLDVLEKLLHQPVVVVGERFEHREARIDLSGTVFVGHVDGLARRVLAIDEGPLEGEVDEAGHHVALPDRDMAQHQRHAARRLQHFEGLPHARIGLVDLVEEEEARDALVLERLQDDLEGRDLFLVGLGDHHREIDGCEYGFGLEGEFDRAGAIEECDLVAHEIGLGDVRLDAHLMRPGLGRGVADRILLGNGPLPGDRSAPGEDRLEKCRLAACERPHQRNAPGPRYSAIAFRHGSASLFLFCSFTVRAAARRAEPIVSGKDVHDKHATVKARGAPPPEARLRRRDAYAA